MMALQSNGISYSFLTNGTAANIKKYFGLQWNTGYWSYNVNNGNGSGVGAINTLPGIAAAGTPHDPDFFELLKASIAVGSLGKAAVNSSTAVLPSQPIANGFNIYTPLTYVTSQVPANYRYKIDTSVDYHIMQIGANIINQFHIDSFPRRIVIKDSSNPNGIEFDGVTDLPYLNYIYNGFLRTSISQGSIVQVPVVFNPYDPNGTRSPTALYPQKFQALIDCNDPKSLANNGGDLSYSTWSSGVDATNGIHFSYSSGALGVGQKDVIQFWPGTGNNVAFREPTWLIRATNSAGANGVNVLRLSGNITCIDTNVISGANDKAGASYSPLVLGTVPLTFTFTNASTKPPSTTNITATTAYIGPLSNTNEHRVYFTYRLQYLDPVSGNYITYDTKYGRVSSGIFYFNNGGTYSPSIGCWSDNAKNWTWGASIDPRSARFGIFTGGTGGILAQNEFATAPSVPCLGLSLVAWIDITNGISLPLRPDQAAGHYLWDPDTNDPLLTIGSDITQQKYLAADIPMTDVPFPKNSAGWGQIKTIMEGPQYVPGFSLGIYAQNNVSAPFYSGRFVPEPTSGNYTTNQPSFYADADGVVRRGTFAYMGVGSLTNSTGNIFPCSASNPVGQPEAACIYSPPYQEPYTNPANVANFPNIGVGYPPPVSTNQIVPYTTSPFSQSQSRPLFLHRPFRSVAELGYVFRDLPWKNIDFSTPESGDTALLDVFCINPTSDPNNLVAGRVDLNTRQTNVLMAIVNGAYVDDPKVTNLTVGTLSTNLASNIATALLNFTSTNTTISTNTGPLMNLANLVGRYVSNSPIVSVTTISSTGAPLWTNSKSSFLDGKSSYIGFSGIFTNNYSTTNAADLVTAYNQSLSTNHQYLTSMINIQRFHEAPIRALSSAGQTRVWNLMIDLIAQTGRYPSSANTLNNFSVEGEQRYWVHLSIDRLTGAVIDKQIEVVRE